MRKIAAVALVSIVLLALCLSAGPPAVGNPSSIIGDGVTYSISECQQRKSFYANGRFWVFWYDGSNMVYSTSADGSTWSDKTVVRSAGGGEEFSIWFDGTYVHYAYANWSPIYYRRGTPNADGTITWSADEQTVTTTYNSAYYVHVSVDSNGYAWVGYTDDGTFPFVIRSGNNDGTWGTTPEGFPYQLTETEGFYGVSVLPLTGNKMLAIYVCYEQTVKARRWDGSSWGAEVETASLASLESDYSAVAQGDDVHVVFSENTNNDIVYTKYDYATNSFGEEVVLYDNAPAVVPFICRDPAVNDLYVFWAGVPNTPQANWIFYRKYDASTGTWGSVVDWIDETDNYLVGPSRITTFYLAYGGFIGVTYLTFTGGSSPIKVKFEYLSTAGPPSAPSLVFPGAGFSVYDNTPTFAWMRGANADNHRIEVDNDSDFSSPVDNVAVLPPNDNTWTKPSPGYAPGIYYWRVWAINQYGESCSAVRQFKIVTPAALSRTFKGASDWNAGIHLSTEAWENKLKIKPSNLENSWEEEEEASYDTTLDWDSEENLIVRAWRRVGELMARVSVLRYIPATRELTLYKPWCSHGDPYWRSREVSLHKDLNLIALTNPDGYYNRVVILRIDPSEYMLVVETDTTVGRNPTGVDWHEKENLIAVTTDSGVHVLRYDPAAKSLTQENQYSGWQIGPHSTARWNESENLIAVTGSTYLSILKYAPATKSLTLENYTETAGAPYGVDWYENQNLIAVALRENRLDIWRYDPATKSLTLENSFAGAEIEGAKSVDWNERENLLAVACFIPEAPGRLAIFRYDLNTKALTLVENLQDDFIAHANYVKWHERENLIAVTTEYRLAIYRLPITYYARFGRWVSPWDNLGSGSRKLWRELKLQTTVPGGADENIIVEVGSKGAVWGSIKFNYAENVGFDGENRIYDISSLPAAHEVRIKIDLASGSSPEVSAVGVTADPNSPPTCTITSPPDRSEFYVGFSVNFSSHAFDPDGDPLTYLWQFGDGRTSTSPNPSHTYTSAGTYGVLLTVSDGDLQASDSIVIYVYPYAPPGERPPEQPPPEPSENLPPVRWPEWPQFPGLPENASAPFPPPPTPTATRTPDWLWLLLLVSLCFLELEVMKKDDWGRTPMNEDRASPPGSWTFIWSAGYSTAVLALGALGLLAVYMDIGISTGLWLYAAFIAVAAAAFATERADPNQPLAYVDPGKPEELWRLAAGGAVMGAIWLLLTGLLTEYLGITYAIEPKVKLPMMSVAAGILFLGFLVPIIEEQFFRQTLAPTLAERFGIVPGIVLSGALFGVAHYIFGGSMALAASAFGFGAVLAYFVLRHQGAAFAYSAHITYNVLVIALSYLVL
jgi:membrane protease YdiL (CAAX protease family)/PKD repeat protein